MAAYGINFVDEDNAWSVLLALLEQVTYAACADADEHLNKVRAGDTEKRHVGFAGNSAGQQSFASARMTYQQHAFGNASAELLEFLCFAQEFDDLPQFFFVFIHAGHVSELD